MGRLESITHPHHILLIGEIKNEKNEFIYGDSSAFCFAFYLAFLLMQMSHPKTLKRRAFRKSPPPLQLPFPLQIIS